eukprot:jgi/Botrbrau1/22612/Bobra.176_1s0042.1
MSFWLNFFILTKCVVLLPSSTMPIVTFVIKVAFQGPLQSKSAAWVAKHTAGSGLGVSPFQSGLKMPKEGFCHRMPKKGFGELLCSCKTGSLPAKPIPQPLVKHASDKASLLGHCSALQLACTAIRSPPQKNLYIA